MIRSILHDGPIATAASLIAVLIIIAFTIRPPRGGADGAGDADAGRAAGWWAARAGRSVRVTFLNFIALPITFGIGAEYALNVRDALPRGARRRRGPWSRPARRSRSARGRRSSATARCWRRATRRCNGFGLMAIMGEVACLSAAIVALPALLFWRHAGPFQEEPRRTNGVGETAETLASDRDDPRQRVSSGRTSKRWQALPLRLAICIRFATDQRPPVHEVPRVVEAHRLVTDDLESAAQEVTSPRQPAGTARTRSARRRAPRAAPARTGAARSLSSGRWYRRPSAPSPGRPDGRGARASAATFCTLAGNAASVHRAARYASARRGRSQRPPGPQSTPLDLRLEGGEVATRARARSTAKTTSKLGGSRERDAAAVVGRDRERLCSR